MLKIGITGATGSLGKFVKSTNSSYKLITFKQDIRSKSKLSKWFKKNKLDAMIHLAAIVPIKDVNLNKKKAFRVNFVGTKNIVDEVIKNNLSWFFFSSTSHVYASSKKKISESFKCKPISYYGFTKKKSEDYIIKNFSKKNMNYCIGRIFSTTNNNQKKNYLVPDLKKKIKNTKHEIILNNLNHYRDFISMKDISKIILFLYSIKFKGIINLGSGKKVHLKKIAKIIGKKYKKKLFFHDNKIATYLVANNDRLKKIYKNKLNSNIEEMIF